ncbi:hypothetical protein [Methanoculleus oceani]|uniref:SpoVT-AbrB domain-containing protein n=1 Tax=Methanoculleus oceani TaxID=2184756 RepID=A0ABD4TEW1_9EURY|nr:hypothetical protein [Methanoculleus sp. CWC-02]MCM2466486.1 hypothetical protein [Methanoculleus sp. CWC-02]
MKKDSDDEIEELQELPEVDYSTIPPEIEGVVGKQPHIIEKKVKLTWDGKQFSFRIPTEIAEEMKITKEHQVLFRLKKPVPGSNDEPELSITLL